MSPLSVNGLSPVLPLIVPIITVSQHGAQTQVSVTPPMSHDQAIHLLMAGVFALHQQLVLAQAGQQPLVQPATPLDVSAMHTKKDAL